MTERDKIADRVIKLLAITEAKGATPAEAATATGRAEHLTTRHTVTRVELHGAATRYKASQSPRPRPMPQPGCPFPFPVQQPVYQYTTNTANVWIRFG